MDHIFEIKRYERLEKEARNQVASAMSPEYYRDMAEKHRRLHKETNGEKS